MALLLAGGVASMAVALSRGVFLYGDDILMFQVARSLVEGRGLEVRSPSDRGHVARSIPGVDGRRYSKYGLGLSLVAAPFSTLGDREPIRSLDLPETADGEGNARAGARVFAAGLANAAVAGALAAALFRLALELGYGPGPSLATALLAALASPLPHYAAGFLSEPLSALCLTVGVLGLAKSERLHRRESEVGRSAGLVAGASIAGASVAGIVIGGVAAGLALLTRLLHLLLVVPLAGAMLRSATRDSGSPRASRGWSFLLWAFPVLAATAALGLANFDRFGSVLETGYGAEASSFGTPLLEGLAGQLVSPGKGLLWFCPAVLLGLAGFRGLWRRSPLVAGTILSGSVLLLLATSKYYQWHGGGCWGPRFLVPLLPLWLLPAAEVFSRWGSLGGVRRALVVAFVALSLAAAALPILVPFDRHVVDVKLEPERFAASVWTWRASPLLLAVAEAPAAVGQTLRKLAGAAPLEATHLEPARLHAPDAAFVRYGSHALLQWTRAGLALALAALGLAVWRVRCRARA
jgi:hypothetical protein